MKDHETTNNTQNNSPSKIASLMDITSVTEIDSITEKDSITKIDSVNEITSTTEEISTHIPIPHSKSGMEVFYDSFQELKNTILAFIHAPKVLWGVNIPNVIEGLVYFGILTILGKFCSENIGLSDLHAGWVYGGVTGGITFAMLILGGVSDKIGVRNSLILSFLGMLAGRILISFSGSPFIKSNHLVATSFSLPFILLIMGILVMVLAYGLFQPATYAAVKKYANPTLAPMAYAALYGGMNLGSFLSGFISPITRQHFENRFPPNGLTAVFWLYSALTLVSLVITVILISRKLDLPNESKKDNVSGKADENPAKTSIKRKSIKSNILGIFSIFEPFKDLRFLFFIFMLIPVQTLFAHNWLTIPYYLDRAYAGTAVGQYYEFFSNLNPLIIFILSPLIAGLTSKADIYKVMIVGTLVMALPTFLLALGTNIYFFLTFIILMSVGEAIWSPRFLQWVAEMAPEGKVGAYQGVGQFPWFLTKLITSTFSGYFVAKYVPRPGTGQVMKPELMWFIYAIIAMITPIGLLLAKRWMTSVKEEK